MPVFGRVRDTRLSNVSAFAQKNITATKTNKQITGRVATPTEPEVAAVHVPSKAIGFILGHRGASIQALTEKTGAQLRVAAGSEVTTGSGEHRVSCCGSTGMT